MADTDIKLWTEKNVSEEIVKGILMYFTQKFIELSATDENKENGIYRKALKIGKIDYLIDYSFKEKEIYISPLNTVKEFYKHVN